MKDNFFKTLIANSPFGFAYHKILLNEAGDPVDYEFLEVNKAFEELTGLKVAGIAGKKVSDVLHGIRQSSFNWVAFFGKVALEGGEEVFEQYSEPLNRWYKVQAYSPEKYYFATVFTDITAEKVQSERLSKTEKRYRGLIESQSDLIVRVDNQNRFTFVNDAYCRTFGKTPEELIGNSFFPLVHEDDREATAKTLEQLKTAPYRCYIEQRAMTVNGWRWLAWEDNAILDEKGSILEVQGVGRDITLQKENEESLSKQAASLQALISGTPAVIYSFKMKDGLPDAHYISENVKHVLGYAPEDFYHNFAFWRSCIHPDDMAKLAARLSQETSFLIPGQQGTSEYRFKDSSGNYRWISDRHKTISSNTGETEVVGVWFDVTEEKQKTEELNQYKQRLTLAQTFAKTGSWEYDIETGKLFWSKECEALFGLKEGTFEGTFEDFLKRVHPDDRNYVLSVNNPITELKEGIPLSYEHRIIHAGGNVIWVKETAGVVNDHTGAPLKIIGFIADITQQKIAEEAIENEEKLQQIVNNINGVFWLRSADRFEMLYVSPSIEPLFGITQQELYANPYAFTDAVHRDDKEKVGKALATFLKTGVFSEEYRIVKPDGEIRWMASNAFPVKNETGETIRFAGIVNDITKQKESEIAEREHGEKLNALIEAMPDIYFMMDRQGVYHDVITADPSKLLVPPEMVIGRNIADFFETHEVERQLGYYEICLNEQRLVTFEYELLIENKPMYFEARLSPVNDEMLLAVVRDITQQKQLAEDLRNELEFREFLFETNKDGMVIFDDDHKVIDVNTEFCQMLGYTSDEMKQLHTWDFDSLLDENKVRDEFNPEGEIFSTFESVHRRKDGSTYDVEVSARSIRWKGQRLVVCSCRDITERIAAAKQLEASGKKYRQLVESINDVLFTLDEKGTITYMSPVVKSLTGFEAEKYTGAHFSEFIHPEHLDEIMNEFYQLKFGKTHPSEYRILTKSGEDVWVKSHTKPGVNEYGQIEYRGIAQNITESRKAAIEIKESEEKYRMLFNANKDSISIFYLSEDGQPSDFIEMNEAGSQITGYDREELLKMKVSDIEVPASAAEVAERIKILKEKGEASFESKLKKKNRELIDIEAKALLISYNNRPALLNITRDITTRKKAANELRTTADRLRLANMATNDVIWDWDVIRDTQQWNEAGTKVFGWTEIVERPVNAHWWVERVHPDDQLRVHDSFFAVVNNPKLNVWSDEYRFLKTDNTYAYVMDRGHVLRDIEGNTVRMVGAMQDITERKRAEESLRKSEEYHRQQTSFQRVLMDISNSYINVVEEDFDKIINQSLAELGQYMNADRCYIFALDYNHEIAKNTHEWCADGIEPQIDRLQNTPFEVFPELLPKFRKGESIYINDVLQLADEDSLRQLLEPQGIKSMIAVPVMKEGECNGFLGFDSVRHHHVYTKTEENLLRVFSRMLTDVQLRLDYERQIRLSNEKYRIVADNTISWEFWESPDGEFLYNSPSCEKITGFKPHELEKNYELFLAMIHPDDRESYRNHQHEISEERKLRNLHFRIIKPDGGIRHIEHQCLAVFSSDGAYMGIRGSNTDITERIQAEEMVRQSRALLNTSQQLAHVGGWEWDVEDETMTWTDETYHIHKIDPDSTMPGSPEHIKMSTKCYDPDDRKVIESAFLRCAKEGIAYDLEFPLTQTDGCRIWIRTMGKAVMSGNRVVKVTGTIMDITERKQAEEEILLGKQRLESFLGISRTMTETLEMEKIMQIIVDNATRVMGLGSGAIYLKTDEKTIKLAATTPALPTDFPDELRIAHINNHPHIARSLATGRYVLIPDALNAELTEAEEEIVKIRVLRTNLYLPVRLREKSLGILILSSVNDTYDFSEDEIHLLQGFANQAANVIDNVNNYERLKSYAEELEREILQRKEAEKALRESEYFANAIADNTPALTYLWDVQSNKNIWSNRLYKDYFEPFSSEGNYLTMQDIERIFHPGDFALLYDKTLEMIANKEISTCQLEIRHKTNQGWKWMNAISSVFKMDENGIATQILGALFDINDRKRAEEVIKQNEERFRQVAETNQTVIWELDINYIFSYVSPISGEIWGYKPEDLVGKVCYFDLHPDKGREAFIEETMRFVKETGSFRDFLNPIQKPDGSIIWASSNGRPVLDEHGNIAGYRGSDQDVTDRINAEKELRKFKTISDQANYGTAIVDLEGNVIYVNDHFAQMHGWAANDLLGRNLTVFHNEEQLPQVYSLLGILKAEGSFSAQEVDHARKDGSVFTALMNASVIFNEKGEPLFMTTTAIDITEIKAARLDLLKLTQAVVQSPVSIIITDTNGIIEYVNPAFTKISGYHSEEVIGQHTRIFNSGRHSAEIFEELWSVIHEGKTWQGELLNKKKNGELYWEKATITSIRNEQGDMIRFLAIKEDISEQKKLMEDLIIAKEKAEESNRLKTAFMNNISHEVRTPLNGILGFGSIIMDGDINHEEKLNYFQFIKKNSDRLQQTITDIMDISELKAGTLKPNISEVNVHTILTKLHERTTALCSQRNILVTMEIPDEYRNTTLITDEELFGKILIQLLNNAEKFTQHGRIILGMEILQNEAKFFVKDTGQGISSDKLDMIFEPFMQEDNSTTRGHEGSGLGLAIARGMVELLGGKIWVESEKNAGSVFYFTLPLRFGKTKPEAAKTIMHQPGSTKPLILIAEDDHSNYLFIKAVLQKGGYNTLHAVNGEEAVKMCRDYPEITLILMDIKMPVMNGIEAMKIIREFMPEIPIIATTAYAQTGDKHRFISEGCNDYLSKPMNLSDLKAILAKWTTNL